MRKYAGNGCSPMSWSGLSPNVRYHVRTADTLGFHAALFFTRHYGPNWQDLWTLLTLVQPHAGTRLYGLPDFEANQPGFAGDGRSGGDHAGRVETSLLWAAEPECVDVSRIPPPEAPDPHFAMGDNARESDRRIGERMIADEVRWLGETRIAVNGAWGSAASALCMKEREKFAGRELIGTDVTPITSKLRLWDNDPIHHKNAYEEICSVKTLKFWMAAGLCAMVLSAGLVSGPSAMAQGTSGEKKTSTAMHESGSKRKAAAKKKTARSSKQTTRSSKQTAKKKSDQAMSGAKKK